MSTDLLGPGDAGAARTLTTTTDVTNVTSPDTYFGDCTAGVAGTGTPIVSKFLNRLLQQVRRVIRASGITLGNADDDMLGQAIQSGQLKYAADTGTANALVVTLNPVPLTAPTEIVVKVGTSITGASAITVNSLSSINVKRADGTATQKGDLVAGQLATLLFDGTNYQLQGLTTSSLPLSAATVLSAGSGNFTVPANIYRLRVRAWSGGGGGGGSGAVGAGAGGNSGGYSEAYYPVTPAQVIPYVCGAGGAGGVSGGSTGSTGGTSSFSPAGATAVSITGGGGGGGGGSGSTGASASATGPGFNQNGSSGENATLLGSTYAHGGAGGASFGGGPCFVPFCTTGGLAGNQGSSPGGGGSGAASISASAAGGAGGAGKIIIEY